MIKEIAKSIKDTAIERISNPFTGALILSYTAYNWKVFYFLLTVDSNVSFQERIHFIEDKLCIWHSYLAPFAIALILVLVYPYFLTLILLLRVHGQKIQQKIKENAENNMGYTVEQAKVLREKHAAIIFGMQSKIDSMEKLVAESSAENLKLKKDNDGLLLNLKMHTGKEDDMRELFVGMQRVMKHYFYNSVNSDKLYTKKGSDFIPLDIKMHNLALKFISKDYDRLIIDPEKDTV